MSITVGGIGDSAGKVPATLHRCGKSGVDQIYCYIDANERINVGEISLQPADAIDGLDPDVVRMAQEMHSTEVRFGGNFSSQYDWHQGIGAPDKRITEHNTAWGIPEYNRFGTDEFLRFAKLLHAVPQIDLNMGTGTPAEAAVWVSYIRSHYSGKVIYELGNELYGNWQVGHIPVDQIAARTPGIQSRRPGCRFTC